MTLTITTRHCYYHAVIIVKLIVKPKTLTTLTKEMDSGHGVDVINSQSCDCSCVTSSVNLFSSSVQAPLCHLHLCPHHPTLGRLSVTLAHPLWALFRYVCSTAIHYIMIFFTSRGQRVESLYLTPWLCQPLCDHTRAKAVRCLHSKWMNNVSQNCRTVAFVLRNKVHTPSVIIWKLAFFCNWFVRGTFP